MLPISARFIYFSIVLAALGLVTGGLVLQHFFDKEPCPLCILQRIAFIVVAVLATGAALLGSRRAAGWFGGAVVLSSLAGACISAWHLRLIAQPEKLSCGPGLSDMLDNFPLTHVLPRVFAGSGDCVAAGVPVFGLPLAGWALIAFLLFALGSMGALARR